MYFAINYHTTIPLFNFSNYDLGDNQWQQTHELRVTSYFTFWNDFLDLIQ